MPFIYIFALLLWTVAAVLTTNQTEQNGIYLSLDQIVPNVSTGNLAGNTSTEKGIYKNISKSSLDSKQKLKAWKHGSRLGNISSETNENLIETKVPPFIIQMFTRKPVTVIQVKYNKQFTPQRSYPQIDGVKFLLKDVPVKNKSWNTSDCVNKTRTTKTSNYSIFQFTFDVLLTSVVIIVGIIGNVVSMVVFNKHKSKTGAMLLLQSLAVADSLVLVLAVPMSLSLSICLFKGNLESAYYISDKVIPYVYPVDSMAHSIAVWMIVVVTLDRFIAICFPFKSSRYCTRSKAKLAICAVVLSCIIFHIPRFFHTYYITRQNNTDIKIYWKDTLGGNTIYRYFYHIGLTWLLVYMMPLILLSFLNIKLWKAVKRAKESHCNLTKQHIKNEDITIAINIIAIVTAFIICQTPTFISLIVTFPLIGLPTSHVTHLLSVSNLLVLINSAINFAIYCLFYEKFRIIATRVVLCYKPGQYYNAGSGHNNACTKMSAV